MSEDKTATSGAEGATSGASDKTYNVEFVEKLKKELEHHRAKAKSEEEMRLKEKDDFKSLAEIRAREAEEWKTKYTTLEHTVKTNTVESKLKEAFLAKGGKAEFLDDALTLMPKTGVAIDPETNVVVGIDNAINAFYERHKSTGFFKIGNSMANHAAPGSNGHVKPDFKKMSVNEQMEYLRKMHKK